MSTAAHDGSRVRDGLSRLLTDDASLRALHRHWPSLATLLTTLPLAQMLRFLHSTDESRRRVVTPQSDTVIISIGNSCNVACTYCYEKPMEKGLGIERDVLERVIDGCVRGFADLGATRLHVIWFGGEPLLMKPEFYERAIEAQERCRPAGMTIRNSVQTSATLLNDGWLSFFARHADWGVATSIDGPQWLHDSFRRFPSGEGSYARAMSGVARLRAIGARPSNLAAVTQLTCDAQDEVYDYFVSESGFDAVGFNALRGVPAEGIEPLAPGRYGDFLCYVFERWLADNTPVSFREVEQAIRSVLTGDTSQCDDGSCGIVTIRRDGSVYPRPCSDGFIEGDQALGNLRDESFADIYVERYLPKVRELNARKSHRRPACGTCHWFPVCHGDCRHGMPCEAVLTFYEHVERRLADVFAEAADRARGGAGCSKSFA